MTLAGVEWIKFYIALTYVLRYNFCQVLSGKKRLVEDYGRKCWYTTRNPCLWMRKTASRKICSRISNQKFNDLQFWYVPSISSKLSLR